MNHSSPETDLSLLALRYAAGELETAVSAEFEERLETDLDAQLALAQVVQIASALRAESVLPTIVARPSGAIVQSVAKSRRWSPWLAVLSGTAVAAAVLVALREESVPEGAGRMAESAANGAMVTGWAAVELESTSLLAADDAALLVLEQDSSAVEEFPDWLLSAVEMIDGPSAAGDADSTSGDGPDSIDEDT